jgi:two-component system, sensor histidine kinase RegB
MGLGRLSGEIGTSRRDFIRLRTLILLRWMAVAGQAAALLVAVEGLGLIVPLGGCFLTIGLSVTANLVAQIIYPPNKRLSENEALLMLMFDLIQLALLLILTGGLANPFALLMLAPITIAAAVLTLEATLLLGLATALLVTLMLAVAIPLHQGNGAALMQPPLLTYGYWLALLIGTAFLGLYSRRVAEEMRDMQDALLAVQMALGREQKLTDLGGVVAAAAHELGTPLATIKLVSTELLAELDDQPDLADDARLIRDQADRCRDILQSMGRAGKEDRHLQQTPLEELLRVAAEPHMGRGKRVEIALQPEAGADARQPMVQRRPEVIHGLRNLVQNAVDFARSRVWIDASWTGEGITLRIVDDGAGYPPQMLGRIGDPFLRMRSRPQELLLRPEYEGMGLGLFIAKTLLERTGAELTFANASDPFLSAHERPERCGALVVVSWSGSEIRAEPGAVQGENPQISV